MLPTIAGVASPTVFAEVVAADAISLADAGMDNIGVTDLVDAGIRFPADPAGTVTVGVTDLVDAGIPFLADPTGAVTVGVASLIDAGMVTVCVTDLANAGTMPLAETGMVTVGMADGVYAAHMDGKGVNIRFGDRLSDVEGGLQSGMICMISLLAQ